MLTPAKLHQTPSLSLKQYTDDFAYIHILLVGWENSILVIIFNYVVIDLVEGTVLFCMEIHHSGARPQRRRSHCIPPLCFPRLQVPQSSPRAGSAQNPGNKGRHRTQHREGAGIEGVTAALTISLAGGQRDNHAVSSGIQVAPKGEGEQ